MFRLVVTLVLGVACTMASPALARSIATVGSFPSPAPPGSGEPRLTQGPGGAIAMSWIERRAATGHRLRWALWNGRRWSTPATIAAGDSFFVNWADFPSVRWLGGTRWAAHWLWKSGAGRYAYDVRISRSEDGGRTWSAPVTPHRDRTETEHGFVSLLAESGDARAIWLDGRKFAGREPGDEGAEMTVRTAVIGAGGRLTHEAELDARGCECCATAAARTSRGVLVAWRDRDAKEVRDISLARLEGGRWTKPYPLHRDGWTIAGCPVNGPALDAIGDRVAVAWFTGAGDRARVLAALSSDGGRSFGAPIPIDEGAPLGRVGIAALGDGGAVVSWLETSRDDVRILARRVSPAGEARQPIRVAVTSASRASGFPQIVRSGEELVLAWTDAGTPSRIRLARVKLSGAAGARGTASR